MASPRVIYTECEHPEGKKAPIPCTGWCKRTEIKEDDGKTKETSEILPFLNESHGKKVLAGVDASGKPVYVQALTFDDPNFITSIETMPEIDPSTGKPFKHADGQIKVAYRFVAGVHAQAWSAVWLQRLFNMMDQLVRTSQMTVNNTAANAQLLQKLVGSNEGISAIAPGATRPDGG
jgi:hypothetical protein